MFYEHFLETVTDISKVLHYIIIYILFMLIIDVMILIPDLVYAAGGRCPNTRKLLVQVGKKSRKNMAKSRNNGAKELRKKSI